MPEIDLLLGVHRPGLPLVPQVGHGSSRDKLLAAVIPELLGQPRFARRCYFCNYAFGSSGVNCEVFHLDGNHANDTIDNLVPACTLCHQVAHLDLVVRVYGGDTPGTMIFLPELSQPQLNCLVAAIAHASAQQRTISEDGVTPVELGPVGGKPLSPYTVYTRLQARAAQVEGTETGGLRVREGLSNPRVMARVLASMKDADYARRAALLAGVRYLPPLEPVIEAAAVWAADGGGFAHLDVASWGMLAEGAQDAR